MSSYFYFKQWQKTVGHLEGILSNDLGLQEQKAHDKTLCEAAQRLSGILGQYLVVYQELMECLQQNLQVQKTCYMKEIINAVVERILEMKHQFRGLESMYHHFLHNGLVTQLGTPFDIEINYVPPIAERPEEVKLAISHTIKAIADKKDELARLDKEESNQEVEGTLNQNEDNWWDEDGKGMNTNGSVHNMMDVYKVQEKVSEETLEKKAMVAMIQAHERTRQVTKQTLLNKQKREMWQKELEGNLNPPAKAQIRERSALLIQKVLRAYFEIKRKRLIDCKRDESLGLKTCKKLQDTEQLKLKEIKENILELKKKYDEEWKSYCAKTKQKFYDRNKDKIIDDYRDFMQGWFKRWFDEVHYILNIPQDVNGGLEAIVCDEVPSPLEWTELYKEFLEMKKARKIKTALQLKYEKMEAEREKAHEKKEERIKKKQQEIMIRKLLKNPMSHPGYYYPESIKIYQITQMLNHYHEDWDDFDAEETVDVKEKHLQVKDKENLHMDVKKIVLREIEEDVRKEYKILKKALKVDYKTNGEAMPESIEKRFKRHKKEKQHNILAMTNDVIKALEELAHLNILKENPETKIQDFLGDMNFAGDDLRCIDEPASPFRGDLRQTWWERCRELKHGAQRILLVGPKGSERHKLVEAMASVNDATLLDVNPVEFQVDSVSSADIRHVAHSLLTVARATQPAVIHIRDVHRLFYKKLPHGELSLNCESLKKNLVLFLLRKVHKKDNISIIGTCSDPWLTKAKPLLKQFPIIHLVPNTSYSSVVQLLKNWVLENHTIPRDLDVNSLAYLLKGYRYKFIKDTLHQFLTAERIVKIAAFGLQPSEIYNHILENETDDKIDYSKYQDWFDKTTWGIKEAKMIQQQKDFKAATEFYAEREKKKKLKSATSSVASSL